MARPGRSEPRHTGRVASRSSHEARGAPRGWPLQAVKLAVLALPRGAVRDRYRRELVADLGAVQPEERARFALRVLGGALTLRRATAHLRPTPVLEDVMTRPRKPFLCRTNLHHRWEWAETGDGVPYVRCARCHKERGGGLDDGRAVSANLGSSFGSMH